MHSRLEVIRRWLAHQLNRLEVVDRTTRGRRRIRERRSRIEHALRLHAQIEE